MEIVRVTSRKSSGSEMKNVRDFEGSHLKRVVKCSINFDC